MAVDREGLIGRWIHSHEEDSDDQLVFRPADYDFPLSRGRRSLELREDGSLVDTAVGAADAPEALTGTWSIDDDNLVLSGPDARSYRVVVAEADRLVLVR